MEGDLGWKIRCSRLSWRRSEPKANASRSISGILSILSILSKLQVFETSGWMGAIRGQDEQDLQDGGGLGLEDPTLVSEPQAI
jgi:hypothetical protein